MKKPYVTAIILAAGSGTRMRCEKTKQQIEIAGKSILERTLGIFEECDLVNDIIIVARDTEIDFVKSVSKNISKLYKIVLGGSCRAESAKNGFLEISNESEFVAIHDGARCFTTVETLDKVIRDAFTFGAATASSNVYDTVKEIDENGFIKFTHNRNSLRLVQTPQVFSAELYKRALNLSDIFDATITDDNMLLERLGVPVFCSDTDPDNIKITTEKDLSYARFLLESELNNE